MKKFLFCLFLLFSISCEEIESLPPPPLYVNIDAVGETEKREEKKEFVIPLNFYIKSDYYWWTESFIDSMLDYSSMHFLTFNVRFVLNEIIIDDTYERYYVIGENDYFWEKYNGPLNIFAVENLYHPERDKYYGGWAQNSNGCAKFIAVNWFPVDSLVSHELGHSMGLGHSDDKENLMYPSATYYSHISEDQGKRVNIEAKWFINNCLSN